MAHKKTASKRKGRKEAIPVLGMVGVSLSLAGGASAAPAVPAAETPAWGQTPPQITLSEEEVVDVSLGTFYGFDKEDGGTSRLGARVGRGCGGVPGGGACARAR